MKEKIRKIHSELNDGKISVSQATEQVLDLLDVSGCKRCKELEFMIKNGLGFEDMKNDITYPIT